jgi:hypothetical protein
MTREEAAKKIVIPNGIPLDERGDYRYAFVFSLVALGILKLDSPDDKGEKT